MSCGDPNAGRARASRPCRREVGTRRRRRGSGLAARVGVTTASGVALATRGLGFVYPDGTRALSEVSLEIQAGSRVAIVGQNGSGKSTLIRHLNGLLRPTEGDVQIAGEQIGDRHVAELARLVGISFQNPDRQIFSSKVESEVAFGPRNIGVRGEDLQRRLAGSLTAGRARRSGRHKSVRPRLLGTQAAGPGLCRRHGHAGNRSRRADNRPGRERRPDRSCRSSPTWRRTAEPWLPSVTT